MPGFRYVVVDVFTDRPLAGNQLAVFTESGEVPEALYQPLARELNFSETAFVVPPQGDGDFGIRVFTPGRELQFAGHPTLGTAVALAVDQCLGEIRLQTGAGTVPVRLQWRGAGVAFGRMDQPLPSVEPYPAEAELLAALGVQGSELPVEIYDNGVQHVYVCLGSEDEVAALQPDVPRLALLPLALGFSCFAGAGRSWKTRMFGRRPSFRRIQPQARRPVRWPFTSPATGVSASARRLRSPRAPRSADHRPCSRASRALAIGSSAWRSAALRCSSDMASTPSRRRRHLAAGRPELLSASRFSAPGRG
jgi:trans-2,3-dihydro-3-hydroxyanthranilate isomerase